VTVQATDSRGRLSDSATVTGPVIYDYGAPSISEAAAFRCDENGAADDSGTYISVKCTGSVSSCGGHNGCTVEMRRRATGGSWTGWTTLTGGTAQTVNAGLSAASSCQVQFRVRDSLGGERSVTVTIPTAAVTLNLRAGGRGAAFGKYAEADGELQVAWDLKLDNPLEVGSGGTGQSAAYSEPPVTFHTEKATGHSVYVRYSPYLRIAFLRGYAALDHVAVSAGTWFDVCTVAEGCRPSSRYALAASMSVGAEARILPSGVVQIKCDEAVSADGLYDIYFRGMWML
jgi:hypothetical protein